MYLGVPPFGQTVRTVSELTAAAGQVDFYPNGGYIPGYIDIQINGQPLRSNDFTATDGLKVTVAVACVAGEEFTSQALWPVSLVDTYRKGEVDAAFLKLVGGTISGNLVLGSAASGNVAQLALGGYNASGGTGYHTFMSLMNTYPSAVAPNKYFRLSAGGTLEIINSAYSATIFTLSDAGNFSIPGYMSGGGVPLARLTSAATTALAGTADATTYLRGDGSWQTPVAGLTQVSYSQAGSGWLRLSNGFMIQWGITQYIADYGRAFQSFPTSFPNACFSVTCQNVDSEDSQWMDNIRVYDLTTTGFTMFRRGNNSRNWFIAIGY